MNSISFKDHDGDLIAFELYSDGDLLVQVTSNHDVVSRCVWLDATQQRALRDYLNARLGEGELQPDPDYIRRYEV